MLHNLPLNPVWHVPRSISTTEYLPIIKENPEFLEVVDSIITDDDGRVKFHYTLIDYWANWESGTPEGADDAQYAEWVSFDHLEELGLWTKTIEVIQKARKLREIGI